MAVEIVMPRLSDSMEEGTILQWFVGEGDTVKEGEPLVEVETDKASVTYESERDGTVLRDQRPGGRQRRRRRGDRRRSASPASGRRWPASQPAADRRMPPPAGRAGHRTASPRSGGRVKASPLARRIAAELGVDLATLAGSGPQGRVIRADVERSAAAASRRRPAGAGRR